MVAPNSEILSRPRPRIAERASMERGTLRTMLCSRVSERMKKVGRPFALA